MSALDLPQAIAEFWVAQAAAKPTAEDIAWIGETWGGPLPAAYRVLLETYGHVSLEDAEGVPRWLTYEVDDDGMTSVNEASVWKFLDREEMRRLRAWLVEDSGGSLVPPGHIVMASGGGDTYFLMEVGEASSTVFLWEEKDDPWGDEDNNSLSVVGGSLSELFAKLRVS